MRFYINNISIGQVYIEPLSLNWNTTGEKTGNRNIKVICTYNQGDTISDETNIVIIEGDDNIANLTVNDYNGNVYKTTLIGEQLWLAENIKSTHYSNRKSIPIVEKDETFDEFDTTSITMCYYNDLASNFETYGELYTWPVATNGAIMNNEIPSGIQGVCPVGWHTPSLSEWEILENFLGENVASDKLKQVGNAYWLEQNINATNETGFTALPSGKRFEDGSFYGLSYNTSYWSTSGGVFIDAIVTSMSYNSSKLDFPESNKVHARPVRCIKDTLY